LRGDDFVVTVVQDVGICVRQWDWSETSQVVCVLGRESGLVRAVAKGSKRPKAKFSGGVEVPTRGEFQARVKQAEGLSLLTAWDLVETFPKARGTVSGFYAALALVDVAYHAMEHSDPYPAVFDELLACLRAVGEGERRDTLALLWFVWCVLSETGHRPELECDVRTGEAPGPEASWAFAPRLGGLVTGAGDATSGPVWRVRGSTVKLLRGMPSVFDGGGVGFGTFAERPETEAEGRALRLLVEYFKEVFHAEAAALRAFVERG